MTKFNFDGGIMEWVVNIKYFSKGAKKFNEDYVGVTTYTWWVLDGSHCGVKLTQNDATWFVTTYSKYLTEFAEKFHLNLEIVLEKALYKTTLEHEILKRNANIDEREYINPTIVLGVIRLNPLKEQLEIYKLGDVWLPPYPKG